MADIANIGFGADTGALADAKVKIEALVPAAGRAERSADRLNKMLDAGARSALAAAKADVAKANAVLSAAKASDSATKADISAASAAKRRATATLDATKASQASAAAARAEASALDKVAAANNNAANAARKRTSVPSVGRSGFTDSQGPKPWGGDRPDNPLKPLQQSAGQFNASVGNIAAQFQDIGVTAAMGMNPLLIALQQGTQLSMAMGGGVKALVAALATVFSPVALLTIALVALGAALIQMVNWTSLAQTGLNALATLLPMVAQGVALLGAVVALAFAPAALVLFWNTFLMIAAGIATLIGGIVASVGAIPIAIGLILADLYIFRDEWAQVLGFDLIGAVKTGVNYIIGAFVGAYHDISFTWSTFPDIIGAAAIGAANLAIRAVNKIIEAGVKGINMLIRASNQLTTLGGTIDGPTMDEVEYKGFDEMANGAADRLAAAVGKRNQQLQKDLTTDYLGAMGAAVQTAAERAGAKIKEFSGTLDDDKKKKKGGAGAKGGKTDGDKFEDIVNGAERSIAALQAERDAIGMSEEATARLKYETQLLNEAKQKGIDLSPQQRAQLVGLAGDMARLESETKKAKDALDFSKEATKGFVMDMKSSLAEGKSLWESFTTAIGNLANKLIDRGLNALIDKLFEVNSAASGAGGSGGIMGWITKGLGSLFGGGGDKWAGMRTVTANAKGNAFSNSVVSKPTMFAFGKGGSQLGIMGEKDPEAVMPLKRGPDGSLGVQMHGGSKTGGQMNSNVVVQNNYTIAGAISSDEIKAQIKSTAEATREEVKRSLVGDIQQFQRDGAF